MSDEMKSLNLLKCFSIDYENYLKIKNLSSLRLGVRCGDGCFD